MNATKLEKWMDSSGFYKKGYENGILLIHITGTPTDLASAHVECAYLEDYYHVTPVDKKKDEVVRITMQFFDNVNDSLKRRLV